ncbi:MAG: amidohydrolase family protein, partial [Woeseiaceae bacterium]
TNNMSLDMHVLETKTQRVHGELLHGKSFVRYVEDVGALNDNTILIHCVWIDDEDMQAIAQAGAVIAHNPISNLRIGSGVMPFKAIHDYGIPVCLGTDEPSVDESSNLWNNARTGALLQKITDPDYDTWPDAELYVRAMCNGGARAMRQVNHIGSLESGKEADLVLLDLDSLSFTPRNNLLRQLVFSENGSSVRMTMVAGQVVYRNGQFETVDEQGIKDEIKAFWSEYRADCDAGNEQAVDLVEVYKSVCMRAAGVDVGFSRWLKLQ